MHTRREPDKTKTADRAAIDAEAATASPRARTPHLHVGPATQAYIRGLGPHNAEEDLHPHRLDAAEADLDDALGREDLARPEARRDARDAV